MQELSMRLWMKFFEHLRTRMGANMLEVTIPGHKTLSLSHLVLDYNGTTACDGKLIDGVAERLAALSRALDIHVLTADTFGTVQKQLSHLDIRLSIIPKEEQAQAKSQYIRELGAERCGCVGNGRNDRLMLKEAALGIAVMQNEGAAVEAVISADVVVPGILDALDLLLHPLRLSATLRS
jgi:soluble P-type ATPase